MMLPWSASPLCVWCCAAWAVSAATAGAQVNPDACRQVRVEDVATLISLDQSTVQERTRQKLNECDWDVETAHAADGEVRLKIEHFDSHAAAVASLRDEAPLLFDKGPMLVKTAGPDDHLRDSLLESPAYADAEAVHGEYLARVEVQRFETAARAHPTFEYRLQRLALQAAGATILPTMGLQADPVWPGSQQDAAGATTTAQTHAVGWSPWFALFVAVDAVAVVWILRRVFRR